MRRFAVALMQLLPWAAPLARPAVAAMVMTLAAASASAAEARPPAAAAAPPPTISLLTVAPGTVYWQRFGHNALLVRERGVARVYNYGVFDFAQDNFFLNFARGRMRYLLIEERLPQMLAAYAAEGREVVEQPLDLAPGQARALRDLLAWNARPENAEYDYDYFLSNCSTRVRDALDLAMGGELRRQLEARPAGLNFRQQVQRLTAPDRTLMLGLDASLGPAADRARTQWEEAFVPEVLRRAVREVYRVDAAGQRIPVAQGERQLLPMRLPPPPETAPRMWAPLLGIGLLLGGVLAAARPRPLFAPVALPLLAVAGGVGWVLLAIWALTDHWAGWANANLLLFNPLAWALLPAVIAVARRRPPPPSARGLAWLLLGCAVLAGCLGVWQANLHWVLFWLPVTVGLVVALTRAERLAIQVCNNPSRSS